MTAKGLFDWRHGASEGADGASSPSAASDASAAGLGGAAPSPLDSVPAVVAEAIDSSVFGGAASGDVVDPMPPAPVVSVAEPLSEEQVLDASDFPPLGADSGADTDSDATTDEESVDVNEPLESIDEIFASLEPSPVLEEQTDETVVEEPEATVAPEGVAVVEVADVDTPEASLPMGGVEDPRIDTILQSLQSLETKLDQAAKHNDWGRQSLAKLQDEIDGYRKDFLASAQLPLLRRVCGLVASMEKVAEGESPSKSDIDFLVDQVLDLLADQGVEPIDDGAGDTFTGSRHRGMRAVVTADESQGGTIAESLARGWTMNGKVITAQTVAVYKYEPTVASAASEKPEEAPEEDKSLGEAGQEATVESEDGNQDQGGTDE